MKIFFENISEAGRQDGQAGGRGTGEQAGGEQAGGQAGKRRKDLSTTLICDAKRAGSTSLTNEKNISFETVSVCLMSDDV